MADDILVLVNELQPGHQLKYNKHHIGLARSGIVDNFVTFLRRKATILEFKIPRSDEITARLDESGIDVLAFDKRWSRYRIRMTKAAAAAKHRHFLTTAAGIPLPLPSNG